MESGQGSDAVFGRVVLDLLKKLIKLLVISSLVSCAKISYISDASLGQLEILFKARDNSEVLNDQKIDHNDKEKIRLIQKYKEYFYNFWEKSATKTYSKTTILNRDAVTYLVITSPKDKVAANEECFWFVGCFPYLGFFDYKKAQEFEAKMAATGNDTYLRKVLAYSTLNNFNDPILSTFFQYDEFELAETVFHELFHTIFFVKNEVDLNENLANFFGKKMVENYFIGLGRQEEVKKYLSMEGKYEKLMKEIVTLSHDYQKALEVNFSDEAKQRFVKNAFLPKIINLCTDLKLENDYCWPTKLNWNNATFAAILTYEKSQSEINSMLEKSGGDLRDLFSIISKKYQQFKDEDPDMSFEKFLLQ